MNILKLLSGRLILVLTFAFAWKWVNAQQVAIQVPNADKTNVWVYTPEGYDQNLPEGYPMLLSLHGGSGIVDDNNYKVIVNDSLSGERIHLTPGRLIWRGQWDESLPFIVVSPHLKRDFGIPNINEQTWSPALLDEVVEYVKDYYNVDENQLYVTGISVGATGTWDYAIAYPEKVAAIMPMGGKGARSAACVLKDIPVWAFHGQDDGLVPTRFSTDMVEAMLDCSPAGSYVPHLTLNNAMEHTIWSPLFNGTSGYRIYEWLLSFSRGDHSNKGPFVFAGSDRKVKFGSGPFYVFADYFDSDGSIQNVEWSQVGGPVSLALEDVNAMLLKIPSPEPGVFTFRLTVTDDDGESSFDEVQLNIQASADVREVTTMQLYAQNETDAVPPPPVDGVTLISSLDEEYILDTTTLTIPSAALPRINIKATFSASTAYVKWSVNGDQNVREGAISNSSLSMAFLRRPTNAPKTTGWGVFKGTYLVCATPYSNSNFQGEGTSFCQKIVVTDEVGIQKYYAAPGGNLHALTSWGTNPDGTGTPPPNFSTSDQWFIVGGSGNVISPLTISGSNSRLIVKPGGVLHVQSPIAAPLYVEGKGKINVTGSGSVTGYTLLSRESTVTYDQTGPVSVPGNNTTFGNLNIMGAGAKTSQGGNTVVRGNLVVGEGVDLRGNNGNAAFVVSGNVTIATPSTVPYTLRMVEGYGDQYINVPGDHSFRELYVETGVTASINASVRSTITIGTASGGGRLDVYNFSLLKLNGHNLSIINSANLNRSGNHDNPRQGKIEMTGSRITINGTSSDSYMSLFPARGKNRLEFLDVTIPSNHVTGLFIRDSLVVTEGVRINGGKLNSNGNIRLASSPSGTAFIGISSGEIVGNVNVERLVKPGRLYRYLSFPVEDFSVADLQKFIPVSGAFEGRSPNYSTSPSLYNYQEPDGWLPYPRANSSNADLLHVGHGYAVYVRETLANKKIIMSGQVRNGGFDFSPFLSTGGASEDDGAQGWTLCGNPYASPISWRNDASWVKSGVDAFVYVRDNSYGNGAGKFWVWDGSDGDDDFAGIIPAGQSFWVRSLSESPVLQITQQAKLESSTPELYRKRSSSSTMLRIDVAKDGLKDRAHVRFREDGEMNFVPGIDALKKKNGIFNLSLLSADSVLLAFKTVSDSGCSFSFPLLFEPTTNGNYSLSFSGTSFDELIGQIAVRDNFLDHEVMLREDEEYVFSVNDDAGSHSSRRFNLVAYRAGVEQPDISFHEGYLSANVESPVQWSLDGSDLDGETNPSILPLQPGEYTVRTTLKGCQRVSVPYVYRVTDLVEEEESSIRVFPNPAIQHLKISGFASPMSFTFTTPDGREVISGDLSPNESGQGIISLEGVNDGLYVLTVKGKHVHRFKIAVSR